jgi:hypothetical protein
MHILADSGVRTVRQPVEQRRPQRGAVGQRRGPTRVRRLLRCGRSHRVARSKTARGLHRRMAFPCMPGCGWRRVNAASWGGFAVTSAGRPFLHSIDTAPVAERAGQHPLRAEDVDGGRILVHFHSQWSRRNAKPVLFTCS